MEHKLLRPGENASETQMHNSFTYFILSPKIHWKCNVENVEWRSLYATIAFLLFKNFNVRMALDFYGCIVDFVETIAADDMKEPTHNHCQN